MYIAENRYVENIKLTEHTEMVWIPIATMLEGLKNPSLVQSENKTTISIVDPVSQKPIIIFPPLLKMLENSEVQAYLSAVLNKKTIRAGHTQSVFFENANKRSDSSARSAVSAAALAAAPSTTSSGESTTSANVANQTSRKPHSPSSIKARPIASPDSVKTQITQTVLNRVKVVQELNERNKSHAEPVGSADSGMRTLSQSEIHMKAILQDKFIEGDLEANVRNMLAQYKKHNGESRFEISEILIKKCVEMLEAEKNNGTDYVYFYHSCDSQIAFCYAIYQKIYANLHANNDWSAFRFDQDKFKKFKNIQEFAAYYSNNGSQEINNNVPGYADLALSTNVFLFGNHQQPGSSSIDYMVNNTVAREVELEKMLSEALLPLSIDSNTVASLVSFYHSTFRSQHGSEMYQIMIPKSDVHSVSYPSVTMGKESRLNGESNISNIISTLNDCVTSQQLDDSTLKYIKKLQARWYASPATFVKSNKTSWHKMTSAEQEKLNATNIYNQLNLFADNILSQVLTHSPSDSVLDNDASAFRMVREVNKLNKTPTLFFMSSKDAFARLILSSNEHNIRNYLNKNPAAINQGINYVAETTFNTVSMVNLSPLMAMIMYSSVSVNFLSELFGADYSQNQEIIKMVPQEENDVYEELDLSEKLLYLREFKGVLTYESKLHQISPNDFISILGGLPLNQRTRLVKFAKADSQLSYLFIDYSSSNKLLKSHIQILELLPEKDKQAFYLEHKDIYSALYLNFKGTYAPIMVMKLFSTLLPSFPDLITEHHQDCLDVLKSCTFDEFISTFETASYAKRPAMFDLIGRSIQNKEEFDAILHLIPDTMQDVFSTKYLPDISAVRPTN